MAEHRSMRDRLREEAQKSTTEGASYLTFPSDAKVVFFNPKAGDFELDAIPFETQMDNHPKGYEKGELRAFLRFKVHGGIGAEDNKYVCPVTINKACPICEERKRMAKSKSGDNDLIKALTPKERCLFQVIDLLDKKNDAVQLWDASYHAFAKQLLKAIDTAENSTSTRKRSLPHAGFAELDGGQTLLVTMEESEKIKGFFQATRIDAADRESYGDEILDEVLDLDSCLKILDFDALEAIFLELDPTEQGSNRNRQEPEGRDGGSTTRSRGRGEAKEEARNEDSPPSRERGGRTRGETKEEPKEERSSRRGRSEAKEEVKEEAKEETTTRSSRRGRTAEPEAKEEVKEETSGRRGRGETAAKEESKCWVKGGVFGKDCDTHLAEKPEPNCYDCPEATWQECKKAQLAMEEGK